MTGPEKKAYTGPWLARDLRDPAHLAIAYMEGGPPNRSVDIGMQACRLATSHDMGTNWQNRVLVGVGGLFPLPTSEQSCAQPTVAFGPDGTLYYFFAAVHFVFGDFHESIYVIVSPDGGRTFVAPHTIDPNQPPQSDLNAGAGYEQPKPAVDPRSGRVFLAFNRYGREFCCESAIMVTFSDDHGTTFAPPQAINDPAVNHGEWPNLSVSPVDGAVYVSWLHHHPDLPGAPESIDFSRSLDGGLTFTPPQDVSTLVPGGCPNDICYDVNPLAGGDYAIVPFADVAAGPRAGEVLLTWSSGVGDIQGTTIAAQGPGRVHVVVSTDWGSTWSPPSIVGVPPGRDADTQEHPWLAVAPGGLVYLAFFDSTPDDHYQNLYLMSSSDGASTFTTPELINSAPIDTTVAAPGPIQVSNGDNIFIGRIVDAGPSHAYLTWNDTRRGSPPDPQCENYNLTPPYWATNDCIPKEDVAYATDVH